MDLVFKLGYLQYLNFMVFCFHLIDWHNLVFIHYWIYGRFVKKTSKGLRDVKGFKGQVLRMKNRYCVHIQEVSMVQNVKGHQMRSEPQRVNKGSRGQRNLKDFPCTVNPKGKINGTIRGLFLKEKKSINTENFDIRRL